MENNILTFFAFMSQSIFSHSEEYSFIPANVKIHCSQGVHYEMWVHNLKNEQVI